MSNLGIEPQVRIVKSARRLGYSYGLTVSAITGLTSPFSHSLEARRLNTAATPDAGWSAWFLVVVFGAVAIVWGRTNSVVTLRRIVCTVICIVKVSQLHTRSSHVTNPYFLTC